MKLARESKFKKLGRLNGEFVRAFIFSLVGENARAEYFKLLLSELETYSFRPHYEYEERHEGCRSWINELPMRNLDYSNPRIMALKVKADLDGLQQKRHARNYHSGFLEGLA